MRKTDGKNHFQKAVNRYYLRAANLNLYVQNIQPFDHARVRKELTELYDQLNELTQQMNQKKQKD